jgi:hypothetical protein
VAAYLNHYGGLCGWLGNYRATVEVYNKGETTSDDTIAVVLHYVIKDDKKTIEKLDAKDIVQLSLRNIAPGETATGTSTTLRDYCLRDEDVVVVVFDRSKYLPQEDLSVELNIPQSWIEEWTNEAKEFCSADPEKCARTAGIFVGNIIKTVTGTSSGNYGTVPAL